MNSSKREEMDVYIEGHISGDATLQVPLPSAVIIFLLNYCNNEPVSDICLNFLIKEESKTSTYVDIDRSCVENLNSSFISKDKTPKLVLNCALPVIEDHQDQMVRSGLCCTVRHIIKGSHDIKLKQGTDNTLLDLLGFRAGSLKACSEVSGWTKLCEVELPDSIGTLINTFRQEDIPSCLEITVEIMKLELHFEKPPPLHNDDKKKRKLLKQVRQEVADLPSTSTDSSVVGNFFDPRELTLPHGNMYYHVITKSERDARKFVNSEKEKICKFGCTESRLVKWCAKCNDREKLRQKQLREKLNDARRMNMQMNSDCQLSNTVNSACSFHDNKDVLLSYKTDTEISTVDDLLSYVESLTLYDIEYEHKYAEGIEFTVADMMLFVYFYHLLKAMEFECSAFLRRLPYIHNWLKHLVSLPRMQQSSTVCGFKMDAMRKCLEEERNIDESKVYTIPEVSLDLEEDSTNEITRRCKGKHRALKKEIAVVLDKVQECGIKPHVGCHPKGTCVQVDWKSVPLAAHPKQELPEKRVARKCEQLENVATAVTAIAQPGDVIVDFCSGGGHLGIIIAYLLPECKVYLVENKEESLIRAKKRVNQLQMSNVSLYHCNLDYFQGQFDIGTCLHACGVATDLVLQQCLHKNASFVVCPCCYGNIQNTHLITYPRSQLYQEADFTDKDVIILGHAADQTEDNIELQSQGRHCMNLVDTDRASLAKENGYSVTLCSLQPLSCTPKNNLLVGIAPS